LIKDFAQQIGVTEDAAINWKKRGRIPCKKDEGRLIDFSPTIFRFFKKGSKKGIAPSKIILIYPRFYDRRIR
jgi:hypothetical protein